MADTDEAKKPLMPAAQAWSLVMILVIMFILTFFNVLYTRGQISDSCPLAQVQDNAYTSAPPTTVTGKIQRQGVERFIHDHC